MRKVRPTGPQDDKQKVSAIQKAANRAAVKSADARGDSRFNERRAHDNADDRDNKHAQARTHIGMFVLIVTRIWQLKSAQF